MQRLGAEPPFGHWQPEMVEPVLASMGFLVEIKPYTIPLVERATLVQGASTTL